MAFGPFDLPGGQFLVLYLILLAVTVTASLIIPRWLRPEGSLGAVSEPEELAYLAGGEQRFSEAVMAQALASNAIAMEGRAQFVVTNPSAGVRPAARALLSLPSPFGWRTAIAALKIEAERVEQRLVRAGQLMDKSTSTQMRLWQASPYLALLVFGAIKWEIGTSRGRPVGFLTGLLIVTVVLAVIRFAVVDRRTRQGAANFAGARAASDRLGRAPMSDETGMAVALFGTSILAGSALGDFHQLRASNTSSSGCSSDSGCSGDSGCGGGGGCGGCGGD